MPSEQYVPMMVHVTPVQKAAFEAWAAEQQRSASAQARFLFDDVIPEGHMKAAQKAARAAVKAAKAS